MTIFTTEFTEERRQLPFIVQAEDHGDGYVVISVTDANGEYWTLGMLRDNGTFLLDSGIEDIRIQTNERGEILVFSDGSDTPLNVPKKRGRPKKKKKGV